MPDAPLTSPAVGCAACWPQDAGAAWAAAENLTQSAPLVEDSHLTIGLARCPSCGQEYVSVFLEHVDWTDGDDAQYRTIYPLSRDESARLRSLAEADVITALNALDSNRRCLQRDHPKGEPASTTWGRGMWITL
jgi:hypothetical protein